MIALLYQLWTLAALLLWLGVCTSPAADSLLGPAEELALLDDFTTNSVDLWQASSGGNIAFTMVSGRTIPGVADSVMQLEFKRRNPKETAAGQNWCSLKRSLEPGQLSTQADGLRLVLGSPSGGEWWMNVTLRVGAKSFSHAIQPILPARTATEHLIAFEQFTADGRSFTREQAPSVEELSFLISANGPSLYLDRISTYRREKYTSWLAFASGHTNNNIFEPRDPVAITLTPGGTVPDAAKAFRFEVQNFFEQITASGKVSINGSTSYKLDLTPKVHGYYELRAFWLDGDGKDLENRSCILAEGSLPPGVATFAMMPRTSAQNIDRFKVLGTNAFFGLHGDFMGLADTIGLAWRFDYSRWPDLEPEKPDRSHGLALWAAERIQKESPRPPHRLHILPFCGNFGGPAWAPKNKPGAAPPYANWEDYLAMLRDYVEVEKHLYPHLSPRIYGAAWEVNLNMPPSNFEPPYTVGDIVELHRHTRQAVKQVDPQAFVIGPCPSNLNPGWFEAVFKAGLLDYIDGIESHGYTEGAFSPEENDYPHKFAAIRELMRQYNHERVLPIYITEAGFRGQVGSKIIHRTQAELMTRLAIILKGEGVRVFLPFYGIDYDRDGWWGFCFNLEVDAANPWMTQRIAPKPTVNALAACAGLLEGTAPLGRVRTLGTNVWAYAFDRQGTNILAVWEPSRQHRVSVPIRRSGSLEVMDIMGHVSWIAVQNGCLDLDIGPAPKYVIDVPSTVLK